MSTPITPVRVVLLDAVTSGTSDWFPCQDYTAPALYLKGAGTISTGTLIVEEADWDPLGPPYTGTASTIYFTIPPATSPVSSIDLTALSGGKEQSLKLWGPNGYAYVRVRIGTGVTGSGGAVTVTLRATV
jgi:hypothetical protein